ncbi:MAG: hypothetical protein ACP5T5_03110 [Thermoprotei archaeon]
MNSEERQIEVHAVRRGFLLDMPMFDFAAISMSPVQLVMVGACAILAIHLHVLLPLIAAVPASRFKLEHGKALIKLLGKKEGEEKRKTIKENPQRVLKVVGTLRSHNGTPLPFHRFAVYDGNKKVGTGLTDAQGRYAFYCSTRAEELRVTPDPGEALARIRDKASPLLPSRRRR